MLLSSPVTLLGFRAAVQRRSRAKCIFPFLDGCAVDLDPAGRFEVVELLHQPLPLERLEP